MSPTERESWTIPADLQEVAALVVDAARFIESRGVGAQPLFTTQLLIEEIVSNVVRHGFDEGEEGVVHVEVSVDEGGISLVVEDAAAPFDPFAEAPVLDMNAPLQERGAGGMGVHLVRRLANEVDYERAGDLNRVRMRVQSPQPRRHTA